MNEPHLVSALAAKTDAYRPRTRHLGEDGRPRFTNRLILETSPYLLQHAHNPVDWQPWGDDAFAEAAARGVPVFLSVGYSTCHWCHVMEHESFEDEQVAAFMNEHFVPVKVDREERPDVDAVHMEFLQMTTGGGGWPMSVWLTPDRRPLYAGTYFPARDGDRGAQRGFLTLLGAVAGSWREPRFQAQADTVLLQMRRPLEASPGAPAGPEVLELAARGLLAAFDDLWGGFGRAPKFPRPCVLEALLRQWRRSGDDACRRAVTHTLERMYCGGMYDHVAGGFARYSVDREWLVPHFEKMLYDNAQLVCAYLEGWQASGDPLFPRVVHDVLTYLEREMSDPAGGFYSATDADSANAEGHQHEGLFCTWTPAELSAALDPGDAAWVCETFGVRPGGNFEGRSVLHLGAPLADPDRWERVRWRLYAVRGERPAPGLDDKILAAWNGLAISAFARAGRVLGEPRYVARAAACADFVLTRMRDGERLHRSWRDGEARHPAVLEDYATMIQGALDLLEATGEVRWLDAALELYAVLDAHFADAERGGFFRTPDDGEALLFREKPAYDGAEPAGNSQLAVALLRLAGITGEARFRGAAAGIVRSAGGLLRRAPHAAPKLLCAVDHLSEEGELVVIVTPDAAPPTDMLAALGPVYAPTATVLFGSADGALAARVPAFEQRTATGGRPTAYVCVGTRCDLPTDDPAAVAARLSRATAR